MAAALAAAAPGQSPTFAPQPGTQLPPSVASLALAATVRLAIRDGEIVLQGAPTDRALGCTSAGGPGRVHEFTLHPHGTVIAACERGLFVLDREHLVLDRPDLRDGVPPGEPRSVHVDAAGRLWLCTDTAFGVVDVRFGFGRTFTAADGLPPPPFHRVAGGGRGRILLETATGVFAYEPDRGPPPQAVAKTARALTASAEGTIDLDLQVAALGGATLRQRRRHHHLLTAMDGASFDNLRPGRHVIEVHAIDRDLRRVVVAEYDVEVPLPAAFDTALLPAVTLLFAALLWVLAWRGSGQRRTFWQRSKTATTRTVLLMVVLLQLLAACLGYGRSWPFVGFSMYTENWHEDSVLHRPRIEGLRADGSRWPMHEDDLGVVQDGYWQMLAEVVFGGDAAQRQLLAQVVARRRPGEPPYIGFVLSDGRIRLTAQGPVDVAPNVLVHRLDR